MGPGGTLNPEEDCKEAEKYLRSQGRASAPATLTYQPSKQDQSVAEQLKRDELARRFMYTSVQQAAFDELPWGLFKLILIFFDSEFFIDRFEITTENSYSIDYT